MKRSIYTTILILFIFSCNQPEVTPVIKDIQFSMVASNISAQQGDYITFSITREGDFKDIETDTYVSFYLSTDQSYSDDDILLTSDQTANFTNDAKTVNLSVQISGSYIQSKTYFVVAKIVASTASTSVRYCYSPLTVTVPDAGVTFLGINLSASSPSYTYPYVTTVDTVFYENSSVYYGLNYIGSVPYSSSYYSSSTYISYTLYLSTDNVFNSLNDTQLTNSSFEVGNQLSNATTTGSFQLSSTATAGTYYIIAMGSYTYNSNTVNIPQVVKKIVVKKYIDLISITGMSASDNKLSNSESFTCLVTITNGNLTSENINLSVYLSSDQTLNTYSDEIVGSLYYYDNEVNPGINVLTVTSSISSDQNYGSYYLIAYFNHSSPSGVELYSNHVGPVIQVVAPNVSVSGVRLDSATFHIDPGSSFICNLTTVSDFYSNYTQTMSAEVYLSLDNVFSADDISLGARSIDYLNASYPSAFSCAVPGDVSNGSYYIIISYQKPGETDYTTIASTDILVVQSASAVLFRNTPNTNYSTLYLFVDDIYVKTLDCYSNMNSPTCAAFVGAYCNDYYSGTNFYYKFFGSDGSHTFKLRTTNNLSTGAALFSGTFNASSSSCSATDVD